ncbi:CUB domain-containing protein [Winogradskyella schleiferi]|uniref:CUB domain-containing protein n=1 Tax=Winogradskyella schleiferi TaxID=2686078 RepID=UPI0015B9EA92|nr:CUB domain-containing protein [Winogradskyella schleiferi]
MTRVLLLILFFTYVNFSFSQDDPCNAMPLPLSAVGSCTYIIGDNTGATDSSNANIDSPTGCGPYGANYNGADVWFYIDLGPTTTGIQIDLTHIGTSNFDDGVVALYTGNCSGTLTIVACDDDSGSGLLEANISVLNGLTPNTRVYIRVWDWGGNDEGAFNICASEIEDPCNNTTNIPSCGTTAINTTIASGFGAFNDSSCFDVPGDEAVFSFTPTVTGNYSITQISTFGHINYLYQTNCAPTGWTCIDDLIGNNETSGTFTLVAGTTYYILLDSEDNSGGNVSFTLNCPIPLPGCGDSFYDSGGLGGNYSNNENETTTIYPDTPGDAVTATFTTFETEEDYDFLFIYDGPNNTFPLIGTYTYTNSPGTVTSSDPSGALTFVFTSDGSITDLGWEADITCAPYVPPTICGSTFTDSGGGGNYFNDENTTTTLTPDVPGTNLVATFTAFEIEDNYDFLYIYDGPNNTFPLIGTYTDTNSPGTVTSSDPSGALTFVFTSDGSITDPGWEADITCVNNCNLIITDTIYPLGADDCTLDYIELTTNAPIPEPTNTIYSENFSGGAFPAGWTRVNGAASANWIISNTTNAGGTANEAMLDWTGGSHNSTWRLSSPLIDITGQTNLHLGFRQDFNVVSSPTMIGIYVETSTDNTNWTTQYSVLNPSADVISTENIDISALDGNTDLYIRFRLSGNTTYLIDWSIDDIIITADGIPSPPQVTWSPADGLYTDAALTTPYVLGNFAGTVYAAPNGVEIYTAEYPIGCTDNVTVTFNKKIWNGTPGNTDWNTATNWLPNGVPVITNCVVILDTGGNNPIINGTTDGFGYTLTVENNAALTQQSNSTLTIDNTVTVQTGGLYTMEDSSSLIQIDNVNNTVDGTFTMDRTAMIRQNDYVYWSSPVSNFSLSNIYGANTPNYTYQWIPTIPAGNTPPPVTPICFGDWASYSGNMDIGKGYISRAPIGHPAGPAVATATFTGTANNGVITQAIISGNNNILNNNFTHIPNGTPLTVTPLDDNWNLIGNPYPSAISADDFLSFPGNSIIEGAVHIWTHGSALGTYTDSFYNDFDQSYNPNDYITYNLTGVTNPNPTFAGEIASGQGFFVLSLNDNETGSVTFNNSMRSNGYDNSDFYRTSSDDEEDETSTIERHRIWLNLIAPNQNSSSTLVGYVAGATQAKDRLYDAYTFESNTLSIYSKIEDKSMSIQGRQLPFDSNDQVPLGIDVPESGDYMIGIAALDGLFEGENGQDIYLEDTTTGIIHDLRNSPYSFNIEEGTYSDRFLLRYTNETLSVNTFEDTSNLTIYIEDELVQLKSETQAIKSVKVYNVLGQTLIETGTINSFHYALRDLSPTNGVLFVKAILNDGRQKIQKIMY